jgi:iron complex outermembrane recepter protein
MLTNTHAGSEIASRSRRSLVVDVAVAACLLASRMSSADQAPAQPAGAPAEIDQLQQVVVTAQRRTELAQNVPIQIQALTSATISQLHIDNFDDMMKYLVNVTVSGDGPGQDNVYMRGLSTGSGRVQNSGTVGSFPNVAVYLDEQSMQVPGRNLDIYAADLQRVEVLEGPQGTYFGAGAEAGVVRYITNKPELNVTEGNVNGGYALTDSGDPSVNADMTLNLPLIAHTLAARLVIYDDSRGGYINNIPGTFVRNTSDLGIHYAGVAVAPPGEGAPLTGPNFPTLNNAGEAGRAINPVTYKGGRLELLWQVNDNWNALLSESVQNMDAEGVSWEEAYDGLGTPLPDLSVQLYNPSYDKDKFEDTSLTISGRIDALKLVYAGGYLVRQINQVEDYTNYSRASFADYYQCTPAGYDPATTPGVSNPAHCYSPSAYWTDWERDQHNSQELRLSTPEDWRLRGQAGGYYEKFQIYELTDYFYETDPNFEPIAPPAGATSNDPNVRPAGDAFFNDITRGYKQRAIFASVDYDIIPKTLTATLGSRWYDILDYETGSTVGSFYCGIDRPSSANGGTPPNPCGPSSYPQTNLNALGLSRSYVGARSRVNLTWHITPDVMVYYTWSQGFRPGGFNHGNPVIPRYLPDGQPNPLHGNEPPIAYGPDTLVNNEVGFKTQWLDHRLQVNGAVYNEKWENTQLAVLDPTVTGDLQFTVNGPSYQVRGAELSLAARVTHGLTVISSASLNSSKSITTPLLDVKGATALPEQYNPLPPEGSPLAESPPFQGNIRVRYDFALGPYEAFWQLGGERQGGSWSTTNETSTTLQGLPVRFYDGGYTTWGFSAGIAKDAWTAQLYGDNLSNTRGVLSSSYSQYVKADTIIRPRTIGLRLGYKF